MTFATGGAMYPTIAPAETRPPRLAAIPKLPVFLDLAGRRVAVIGGGEPVAWKAELLAAAGAAVEVYAASPHADLAALAGTVTLHRREWTAGDLDGAALVVADEEDPEKAARVAREARARGLLVNVIDNPSFCEFQFGTIVNRAPVVVAISTDGAAPILGQAIRRRIEAVLPASIGIWAGAAKRFRARLKELVPGKRDRRRFWERFADMAFVAQAGEDERLVELERLAARIGRETEGSGRVGEVVIVGAGPGDPELLTLRAMRELQAADVIVYDRLVTPAVLELARREARRVHVGKEGHGAACRQDDISALLVDLALSGQRVVRLKGGDPSLFGRAGEEVAACREALVPVRIVPGVTTASAAAASLNLSLTHRDHAQRVQFVTGHDRHGGIPDDLDYAQLADPRSTLVVYMARRTAAKLATRLLAEGLSPSTPVLAMSDVSRPGQQNRAATLLDLAAGLDMPDRSPVIVLIGAALAAGADAVVTGEGAGARVAAALSG